MELLPTLTPRSIAIYVADGQRRFGAWWRLECNTVVDSAGLYWLRFSFSLKQDWMVFRLSWDSKSLCTAQSICRCILSS
jgi:hypothetical protein